MIATGGILRSRQYARQPAIEELSVEAQLFATIREAKSIAGSLESLLGRSPAPEDWRDGMQRGPAVTGARADALSRFTASYARLARLPLQRAHGWISVRSCTASSLSNPGFPCWLTTVRP
jgi:hypothetical protein